MGPLSGKVEIDVKRQAWVRKHPKTAEPKAPKEPKQHGWKLPKVTRDPQYGWNLPKVTRDPMVARLHEQGFRPLPPPAYPPLEPVRQVQRYEGIPNYSQRESEGPMRGYGDEGRSRRDDSGLGHTQSTRSQHTSRGRFVEDDSDNELDREPVRQSRGARVSELEGLSTHGERHGGRSHHGSRGPSRGQHGRGSSRAQSNAGHGGLGQSRYDFAPPSDRMSAQNSAGRSHRGSQRESRR